MGSSSDIVIRLTSIWKKLPDLNGFDLESILVTDIAFDMWKRTISFHFIEHDDETYCIACISRMIKAWMKRDGNIWKIDKVFWGGLEDCLYGEDFNEELHGIFPNRIGADGERELISERAFLEEQ